MTENDKKEEAVTTATATTATLSGDGGSGNDHLAFAMANVDDDALLSSSIDSFRHKCSICFDADSEVDLSRCGDQFCFACLERYLMCAIERSWGIQPIMLTCPVCKTIIEQEDWQSYVSTEVYEAYQRVLDRERSVSKPCPHCGAEQTYDGSVEEVSLYSVGDLLERLSLQTAIDGGDEPFDAVTKGELASGRVGEQIQCWVDWLKGRKQRLEEWSDEVVEGTVRLTRIFLQSCSDDDEFAAYQLSCLQSLRMSMCDRCSGKFCMQCGGSSWHRRLTCQQFQGQLVSRLAPGSDELKSMLWKLEHCKPCPRCFVFISKDEHGCNEMRCNYCGYTFCWECLRRWSTTCGVFQCRDTLKKRKSPSSKNGRLNDREEKGPEVGVPDVKRIQQRLRFGESIDTEAPPQHELMRIGRMGLMESTGEVGDENQNTM